MSIPHFHNPLLLHILRDFESLQPPRGGKMGSLALLDASDVSLVFELQSKLQKERYLYIDVRYVFLISTDSSYFINILTIFKKHWCEIAVESNWMRGIPLNNLNMLQRPTAYYSIENSPKKYARSLVKNRVYITR